MNVEKYRTKSAINSPSTFSLPVNISNLRIKKGFFEEIKKKSIIKTSGEPEAHLTEVSLENRDPNTFSSRYTKICHLLHTQPLNMVRVLQSNISLDLICDRIKFVNMMAILKTIKEDRSLHYIALTSKLRGFIVQEHINTEKKSREAEKPLFTRFMVNQIGESIGECLKYSVNLTALKLQGIPLRGRSIELLCQGLCGTQTLQHLSLYHCNVGDQGCFELSRALRNIPTLLTMDLSSGNITSEGAMYIANLIKSQELARFDQSWKQSLRYREVNNDDMKGLRRVTLNDNPEIGDEGLKYIIDILMDDFWIRALDMQNCGITDAGGLLALKMIQTNSEIGVVDLRRNPLLSYTVLADIVKALRDNLTPEKAMYGWLCTDKKKVSIPTRSSQATTTSYKNSVPWNCGPGRGNNQCESNFSRNNEESRRMSIMKVIEWKTLKNQEISSSSSGDIKVEEAENNQKASPEDSLPSSSKDDSIALESSEPSDKFETDPKETIDEKPQKQTEDIELLFNKCMSLSTFGDESDSS